MEVKILKIDNRAFLKIEGGETEIKDYKISSSMHGDTELEIVLNIPANFTEILIQA